MWFPGLGTQLVSLTDTDTVFLKSHAKCSLQSYLSGCWFSVYNCYDLHQGYWLPIFTLYLGMLTITMESLWKVQAVLHRASGPKEPLENLALIFFRENNRICFFELKYPFIQIKALLSSGGYSREQERWQNLWICDTLGMTGNLLGMITWVHQKSSQHHFSSFRFWLRLISNKVE